MNVKKQLLSLFMQIVRSVTGGHLKEFTDGESNFTALLQRAMEMEGVDRETLHQLICLLMKVSASICSVTVTADSEHLNIFVIFTLCSISSGC